MYLVHIYARSAKLQVVLNQALDEWFQFARKGLRGVPVPDLVDSIIMLGLNHDHRQVRPSPLSLYVTKRVEFEIEC